MDPSPQDILVRAVFLIALASGLRVSQLAALVRSPALTHFAPGDTSVTLAPYPAFLAKNEWEGHRLGPVSVPAWFVGPVHHALCPVAALRALLTVTDHLEGVPLWLHPLSGRRLRTPAISALLRNVIREGDPGAAPKAHQVRSYSSSVAFFRTLDLARVQRAGQWRSPSSFVTRYLNPLLSDTPCVALGVAPSVVG